MLDIAALHDRILYTQVRVRHAKAGGSGTLLWSQKVGSEVQTFVLTNHHVIADLINITEEWDPYLGRNRKRETRRSADVDRFHYQRLSYKVGEETIAADIVAWHKEQDLALLLLRDSERLFEHIAFLPPVEVSRNLKIFEPVVIVGAALLHPTYPTLGFISSVTDEIDNYPYQMSNAAITFGNSGGGVFHAETAAFLGIPSRVAIQGWADVANHMGFFIPWWRIAEWLDREDYGFISDKAQSSTECAQRRAERKRRAEHIIERERSGEAETNDAEAKEEKR